MGDENPIRTLGDYSKPSQEGYMNTIELPVGNNVVPLRFETIRLVQNGCSFHELRSEDPNQHIKDFLKLVDSLDLDAWRISIRSMDSFQGLPLKSPLSWHRPLAPKDLTLYENKSWNDPRDFAKPVKAIILPQDVPSTSDNHLIKLENQVQRLMEAHLALTQPTQVNKITTSCEICNGPHDTQNCMENPEQAFVEYASSRTDEAGEGLFSEFMASQDARLSKFEADFKRQQGETTNKIDNVLKAITDQIAGTLPSDTVKNLKLGAYPVLFARSYAIMDPQCSTQIHSSVNAITIHPKQPEESQVNEPKVKQEEDNPGATNSNLHPQLDPLAFITTRQVRKLNSMLEMIGLVP
ncbi:hypothetical protein Tco_0255885 [Tanacetum coccineum]